MKAGVTKRLVKCEACRAPLPLHLADVAMPGFMHVCSCTAAYKVHGGKFVRAGNERNPVAEHDAKKSGNRRNGGFARAKALTEEALSESGSKAAKARWARTAKERALKKVGVRSGALVAKVYDLLAVAVEEGVARGLRAADKHADDPLTEIQRERVASYVETAVLGAMVDRFDVRETET